MAIKVSSVEEEYRYLKTHPHKCGPFKKGEWKVIKQALTFDGHDQLSVKCQNCGHETVIEFDISSNFPPEVLEIMKKMGKKQHDFDLLREELSFE